MLSGLFPVMVFLAVLVLVARQANSLPAVKGLVGEWQVRRLLRAWLPASHYTMLHDVTLPSRDGTTQIDHIVVSQYGVFVIETKHMAGWIFGSERDPYWTQTFRRSRHRFQNPLRQNFAHVKALEDVLGLDSALLHSVVVFTGEAKFRTAMPPTVVKLRDLLSCIRSYSSPVIDPYTLPDLIARIESQRFEPNRETHAAHVAALKARHGAAREIASEIGGLVNQTELVITAGKLVMGLLIVGGAWWYGNHLLDNLDPALRPVSTSHPAAPVGTPGRSGAIAIDQTAAPAAGLLSSSSALRTVQADARARESDRALRKREEWEASLLCAHSVDTGRCACYEPKGPKANVSFDLCMALSDKTPRSPR